MSKRTNKKTIQKRLADEMKFDAIRSRLKKDVKDDKQAPRFTFYSIRQKEFGDVLSLRGVEDGKTDKATVRDAYDNKLRELVCVIPLKKTYLLDGSCILSSENTYQKMIDDHTPYIFFGVNLRAPKDIIHFLIDHYLDAYGANPKGRFRGESIQALQVWEEWINSGLSGKKGFPQIAKKLHLPLSTVKTLWYRAHVIVLGKKYVKPLIDKEDAKNKALELLCSKCKDIQCYKERKGRMERIPCAAYLKIAPKDYTQELLTDRTLDYSNSEESFSEEAFLDKLFPEEDS